MRDDIKKLVNNVNSAIVIDESRLKVMVAAILSGGHILIEDMPGSGKTMLTRAFAKSLDAGYKRVSFTPDLLPSDILGVNIYDKKQGSFKLVKGPVFTDILLADEINRATPRTQSALLEAMQEGRVTIDGDSYDLGEGFVCIATENPLDSLGTYELPLAELDRFLIRIDMGSTGRKERLELLDTHLKDEPVDKLDKVMGVDELLKHKTEIKKIKLSKAVKEYEIDLFDEIDKSLKVKLSNRALLALSSASQALAYINGSAFVTPDEVKAMAPYVLNHRLSYEYGYAEAIGLIERAIDNVKVPNEDWKN